VSKGVGTLFPSGGIWGRNSVFFTPKEDNVEKHPYQVQKFIPPFIVITSHHV
jgi:hypothetical protein